MKSWTVASVNQEAYESPTSSGTKVRIQNRSVASSHNIGERSGQHLPIHETVGSRKTPERWCCRTMRKFGHEFLVRTCSDSGESA